MESFDYVIVGGGMIADNAAKALHGSDPDGTVLIVGRDPDAPVTRPALSKKLWTDPDFTLDQVWLGTEQIQNCTLLTGTEVTAIDRAAKTVLAGGHTYRYDKLLLATGGSPTRLDLPDDERVIYFRTLGDYRTLRRFAGDGQHVIVVGGGYIGTELACALAGTDTRVTFVYSEDLVNASPFPTTLAQQVTQTFRDHGVTLKPGTRVRSGRLDGNQLLIDTDTGERLTADAIVVGIGIEPETTLAEAAGLDVDDGVLVDARLTTSDPAVFAAGDVANYPDPILGRRRVEHVDNANTMGTRAGEIMADKLKAGDDGTYTHTPYYYSVLFGTRYEAVGTLDSSLTTIEDWDADHRHGVVYYLDDAHVHGVLLWNVDEGTDLPDQARAVIKNSQTTPITEHDLHGAITLG